MKKLVCGLLIVCLALIMLPVSSARAAEMAIVSISAPSSVSAGGSFVARINFSGVANLNSYQIQLSYDKNVIQIMGEEAGAAGVTAGWCGPVSIPVEMWTFSPPGTPGGTVGILGYIRNNQSVSGSGCLAELHFDVIGSPGQSTAITPTESETFKNGIFDVYTYIITTEQPWGSADVLVFQIGTSTLAEGAIGYPYSFNMTAEGGISPYHWTGAGFPSGLTLSDTGTISGTPVESGDFNVRLEVTDSAGTPHSANTILPLRVYPPLQISTSTLPDGTQGISYSSALAATGGKAPFTWSSNTLPAGLSISTSGHITGTPAVSGDYEAIITIRDSFSPVVSTSRTLDLYLYGALEVATTVLPSATLGEVYSTEVIASGGKAPYTWSASGLPAGLNMSASGNLTGTPTVSGDLNFTVSISDSFSPVNTASRALTLHVNDAVMITTASLNEGTVGSGYAANLTASGGVLPYAWSGTGLPAGLAVLSNGAVSGTPAEAGDYNINVSVTDSSVPPRTKNAALPLHIYSALNITSTGLPGGRPGSGYSGSLDAGGGKPPYSWTVSGLPAGLSAAVNGIISGIPAASGNFNLNVSVTDSCTPANVKSTIVNLKIYKTGDANGDGNVNMGDVTRVELIILNLAPATPGADANGDGLINMGDVTRIEMIILGLV